MAAFGSLAVYAYGTDTSRAVLGGLAIVGAMTAAGVVAIAPFVLQPAMRFNRKLIEAMRSLGDGDLEQRIKGGATREGAELASAFNRMAEKLHGQLGHALREQDRLLAALEGNVDAVLAVDKDGRVAFANPVAHQIFGGKTEIKGRPVVWVAGSQEVAQAFRLAYAEGHRSTVPFTAAGDRHYRVIVAPIASGDDWAALGVFHDITDVVRAESVRRDFIANVSHELRTPLAGVKSVIETLETGALEDSQVAREFLSRMDGEVDRLVLMVEELLELSRIEAGEEPLVHGPVDIVAVLQDAVDRMVPQAQRQRLSLGLDISEELPPIVGDSQRLERAVINLIHNAIKFTPAGGAISVAAAVSDDRLLVKVSDTGVGITPDDLPRIFERFYKADRSRGGGGSGLGLALVKHTVQAHGGDVFAESQPGKGSAFTIALPLSSSHSKTIP